MPNLTDTEKIMVGIAYSDGQKLGEKLAAAIKSGELIIPDNETMEILIDKFITYDFPASHKLLAKIFSPNNYMVGNFLCAGGGIYISGVSGVNFYKTQNVISKACYTISGLCGCSAAICGIYSGVSKYCGLSMVAAGGDIVGGSFLYVGNYVQKSLNFFRPKNFVRRPMSKHRMGYKGMSFVTPGSFDIPFETVIIIGGTIFTIYSYGKLMISISRYINKKFSPKMDHSLIIYSTAKFLIDSLNESEYSKKANRIYSAALSL